MWGCPGPFWNTLETVALGCNELLPLLSPGTAQLHRSPPSSGLLQHYLSASPPSSLQNAFISAAQPHLLQALKLQSSYRRSCPTRGAAIPHLASEGPGMQRSRAIYMKVASKGLAGPACLPFVIVHSTIYIFGKRKNSAICLEDGKSEFTQSFLPLLRGKKIGSWSFWLVQVYHYINSALLRCKNGKFFRLQGHRAVHWANTATMPGKRQWPCCRIRYVPGTSWAHNTGNLM